MKNNSSNKALVKVIKQFSGLEKIEAFDILSKLETFLFYASNPINLDDLEEIQQTQFSKEIDIDPFHFIVIPNGNLCELIACNHYIHIYKEHKKFTPDWSWLNTYYFKSKYNPAEAIKLTRSNLQQVFEGTPEERILNKKGGYRKLLKRDPISGNIFLLS